VGLCECGCGIEVSGRFVSGHNLRCLSEEIEKRRGVNISKALKGNRSGSLNPMYRKHQSEHQREVVREMMTGRIVSQETRDKIYNAAIEGFSSGKRHRLFGKDNPMYGKASHTKPHTEEAKRKISDARYKSLASGKIKPRKKAMTSIEEIVDSWRIYGLIYTGNRTLFVKTGDRKWKFPDFADVLSKKVVEVFGDYWHADDSEESIISEYRGAGWDCCVVWEHDIYRHPAKTMEELMWFCMPDCDKEEWWDQENLN
jgi:hypothetical protein